MNPLHTAIALRGKNDLFAGVVLTEHLDADRQNSKEDALRIQGQAKSTRLILCRVVRVSVFRIHP